MWETLGCMFFFSANTEKNVDMEIWYSKFHITSSRVLIHSSDFTLQVLLPVSVCEMEMRGFQNIKVFENGEEVGCQNKFQPQNVFVFRAKGSIDIQHTPTITSCSFHHFHLHFSFFAICFYFPSSTIHSELWEGRGCYPLAAVEPSNQRPLLRSTFPHYLTVTRLVC